MQTFSYEDFVQAMMRTLGNSKGSARAMSTPLSQSKDGFPDPHGKSLGLLSRDMHIHELHPGNNLDFLENRFHDTARLQDGCYAVVVRRIDERNFEKVGVSDMVAVEIDSLAKMNGSNELIELWITGIAAQGGRHSRVELPSKAMNVSEYVIGFKRAFVLYVAIRVDVVNVYADALTCRRGAENAEDRHLSKRVTFGIEGALCSVERTR